MAPNLVSIRSTLQNFNPARCVSGDIKACVKATILLYSQPSDEECMKTTTRRLACAFVVLYVQ